MGRLTDRVDPPERRRDVADQQQDRPHVEPCAPVGMVVSILTPFPPC